MKKSEQYTDDMQPDGGRKPTYIKEQHNHNCQQFFGNISNCTFICVEEGVRALHAERTDMDKIHGRIRGVAGLLRPLVEEPDLRRLAQERRHKRGGGSEERTQEHAVGPS